jgi:hypothetical protein
MKKVLFAVVFTLTIFGLSACSEEFNAAPVKESDIEDVEKLEPTSAGFNQHLNHKAFQIEDKWDALYEGPVGKIPSELLH